MRWPRSRKCALWLSLALSSGCNQLAGVTDYEVVQDASDPDGQAAADLEDGSQADDSSIGADATNGVEGGTTDAHTLQGGADASGMNPGADAGALDASASDAGTMDASAVDAGAIDAPMDTSAQTQDAGQDAGPREASVPDGAAPNPLLQGCTLLLHMDETSWSGKAGEVRDSSGRGNHGTAMQGAVPSPNGRFGRAGSFNGTGWVEVPDAPSLRPTTALTVSAWFNLDPTWTNHYPGIVNKRAGYQSDSAFAVFLTNANTVMVDIDGEESRFESTISLGAGVWHHVAVVFDGSAAPDQRARLYIDGSLDRTAPEASASIPGFTPNLLVGDLNGTDLFKGLIDEVGVWTRALSPQEVTSLAGAAIAP